MILDGVFFDEVNASRPKHRTFEQILCISSSSSFVRSYISSNQKSYTADIQTVTPDESRKLSNDGCTTHRTRAYN